MRFNRVLWSIVPMASIAIGCHGGGSEGAAPTASASASAAPSTPPPAPPPKPRPMFARHGGISSNLFQGARDLDLTPEQIDAITKLDATLKADDDNVRSTMRAVRADFVAGVKAGKVDTTKLPADDAAVDKAMAEHQAKEAEALDGLYAVLDPPKRTALVESVKTRQVQRETQMTEWMRAKEPDGGALDWNKRRIDKVTADLSLDPGQQKQVAAILAKASDPPNAAGFQTRWEERKKRSDALLTAFAADGFDAKKTDFSLLPGKTAHEPIDHMAAYLSKVLPILHPDQRDKLATQLERPFGAGGRPMFRGLPPAVRDPVDDIVFPFIEPTDNPRPEGFGPRGLPPPAPPPPQPQAPPPPPPN